MSCGSSAFGTGFRDGGHGRADSTACSAPRQCVLHGRHDFVAVRRWRDVLERNRESGDVPVRCGGRGPECDGSNRGSDGGCDPEGYHPSPPPPVGMSPSKTLMVRPSKVQIRQGGQRDGCGEAEVSYLCLEVDPIVRQDSHHGSVFTQLSKKPTSGIDCCDATDSRGLVSIYGLVVPTSAARRSATLLILSRRGAIFDRSERHRSSKYEAKPTISFTMSSTVCGFRPGIPNGHSSSSFALAVSSYRPSSRFFRSSSWVIWSKSG